MSSSDRVGLGQRIWLVVSGSVTENGPVAISDSWTDLEFVS